MKLYFSTVRTVHYRAVSLRVNGRRANVAKYEPGRVCSNSCIDVPPLSWHLRPPMVLRAPPAAWYADPALASGFGVEVERSVCIGAALAESSPSYAPAATKIGRRRAMRGGYDSPHATTPIATIYRHVSLETSACVDFIACLPDHSGSRA